MANDITDVIKDWISNRLADVNTVMPGRIVDYVPAEQKASVEIVIKRLLNTEGANKTVDVPAIINVPVVFPATPKSMLTFPLEKGDGVLVVFSQRSLDVFLRAADNAPLDPEDFRRFDLTDAIALPGLFGFPSAPNDTAKHSLAHSTDDTVLQHNMNSGAEVELRLRLDGSVVIQNANGSVTVAADGQIIATNGTATATLETSGEIKLNNGPGSITLLASGTVNINGLTIDTAGNLDSGGYVKTSAGKDLDSHVHSGVTPGGSPTGPPV